ncbi:glycoside hydrolase family 44 protein [Paraburkholderia sp. CNPSo 3281]|uniref:glycoside hydrolase family 44 protein n=1 Tax=Paraburkholderia sp. CNPSo 3281 TaxID=2940933 RepID=UPI0020B8E9A5|nr:glycoside hydrolase family 44 protein [Paraburkholderia sp. CNPSo 3281]MCP3718913.1 glycoside hydrolase family 44 protein [Paraburkholderia sp. CNPSo 3281]
MPRFKRIKRPNLHTLLVGALLMSGAAACTDATSGTPLPVAIPVDAGAGRHPISPLIYGINFGTTAVLQDLRAPVNRSGGNSASAYNWRIDARNAGKDWYFESLAVNPADINDQFGERFVALTQAAGATPIVTIPMLGRVAKLGPARETLASFSIAKYGPQPNHDVNGHADAGNGLAPGDKPIAGNDANDASTPDDPQNEQARVADLVKQFGGASGGGVRYYALDNEPSLWQLIHRDVHPTGAHASEIASKVIAYSRAVKAADPHAQIVAPEEWGWQGYFYSGFDQQYAADHGLDHAPDRTGETQGMPYVPWLLTQWKAAGHPVDVFSLHFYPQGGEYAEAGVTNSQAVALMRNRSTRDLWDPNYKDPTWINSVVALIPLMRRWVDSYYYPGTPIGITEYNWGGDTLMNGATAQADVLGIFGREGLDIATRWGTLDPSMPVYKAFKLYRNYDGNGAAFGATSIAASVPDPDTVSAFAALRERDHALTLVVINKQLDRPADAAITLDHFAASGVAETWRLANNQLFRMPDARYHDSALRASLPAQSVTLFVLRGAQAQHD